MPTEFTPFSSLIGGALIGLAATWLMAALGRIAGISGIFNTVLDGGAAAREGESWRLAFLLALIAAAGLWFFATSTSGRNDFPLPMLIAAGALVGFGTRLGNGCTSGHGICGLARLSKRSLVAVAVFMAMAFLTTYVVRHVVGGAA